MDTHHQPAPEIETEPEAATDRQSRAAEADALGATVRRPWGHYRSIDRGDRFQVKQIVVEPGGRLSLQKHHHRSEHWVVVSGAARIVLGSEETFVNENEHVFIRAGTEHRLENPGKVPLRVIEVQSGCYLGEDDIVRLDDVYGRVEA